MFKSTNTQSPKTSPTQAPIAGQTSINPQKPRETSRTFKIVERSAISLPPVGKFAARLISIAFLGEHQRTFKRDNGKEESRVLEYVGLAYELTDKNTGEVHLATTECTLSYNPDSRLYGHLLALNNGKPLAEGANLSELLGKPASIEITHRQREMDNGGGSRLYANIVSVSPLSSGMNADQLNGDTVFYDVLAHNDSMFQKLNRKHQWIIEHRLTDSALQQQAA
jgi:hypothetical protein